MKFELLRASGWRPDAPKTPPNVDLETLEDLINFVKELQEAVILEQVLDTDIFRITIYDDYME